MGRMVVRLIIMDMGMDMIPRVDLGRRLLVCGRLEVCGRQRQEDGVGHSRLGMREHRRGFRMRDLGLRFGSRRRRMEVEMVMVGVLDRTVPAKLLSWGASARVWRVLHRQRG